jgi:uncharacterized protein YuzE
MERVVSYDGKEDVLYFNKGSSVQDSLDIGDFFLEFDGEGQIVGVELLNASDTVSRMSGEEFSEEDFEDIRDAEIRVHSRGDFTFVVLYLILEREGKEVREGVGVNLPTDAVNEAAA